MSPQSLAKTRDKRSHRIPARFDDFIPPEVVNHRNVVELRSKPKRVASTESEPDHSPSPRVLPPRAESSTNTTAPTTPAPTPPPATSSSTKRASVSSKSSSSKKSKSKSKEQRNPTSNRPPEPAPLVDLTEAGSLCNEDSTSSRGSRETPDHVDQILDEAESNNTKEKVLVIDLECKETTPMQTPPPPPPPPEPAVTKSQLPQPKSQSKSQIKSQTPKPKSKPVSKVKETVAQPVKQAPVHSEDVAAVDSVENEEKTVLSKRVDAPDVIKKGSPFHPSITISNSYKINQQLTPKPLIDKKTGASANTPSTTTQKAPSPRKKAKSSTTIGSSLLKPNNGAFQTNTSTNRISVQQLPQQHTKYYNNLTPNMQYGTRLMLNEQVYLPRSVGNIAPITTTLQQIANQARKPPFISKKAEAYIAYQEGRKFNYMTSIYTASVRITKYLDVQDLLNLRLVNKTWKSIIDSDAVWKKVTLSLSQVTSWPQFVQTILCRFQTTDLVLEDCAQSSDFKTLSQIFHTLVPPEVKLERIWIQSEEPSENRRVLEFLNSLTKMDADSERFEKVHIVWRVKIGIDDYGLATVPIEPYSLESHGPLVVTLDDTTPHINWYQSFPELIERDTNNRPVDVDLDDLEDFFYTGKKIMRTKNIPSPIPLVLVEPI